MQRILVTIGLLIALIGLLWPWITKRSPARRPDHRQTRLQALRPVYDHDHRERSPEPHHLAPAALTARSASRSHNRRAEHGDRSLPFAGTQRAPRASVAPPQAARVAAKAAASIRIA
jgi:hypothetical protein